MRVSTTLGSLGRRGALAFLLSPPLVACDAGDANDGSETESPDGSSGRDESSGSDTTDASTSGSDPDTDPTAASDSASTGSDVDPANCRDGAHNGDEEDVDCGGSCSPCAPEGWTCEARFYGDGVCQCGCGVADLDCDSTSVSACSYALCPEGEALDPGQTTACVSVPEQPGDWDCSDASFGDSVCDCGCGAPDFDCGTDGEVSCADTHCPPNFTLDPTNDAVCLPPPADTVQNPSFEDTPAGGGDVPGWTVLQDVGGLAAVQIAGSGQTTAPEGARALWLQSTNDDIVGARTVRSTAFLPPAGTCTVTVAVGDSNEDSEFTDFGQLRVRAPSLPNPLDLVAEVDIDNRGTGGVSPPTDGYVDAQLVFATDGETLYHIDIRVRGSFGVLSYHADDVRIACSGQ